MELDWKRLAGIFPEPLAGAVSELPAAEGDRIEEFRLRAGCPATRVVGGRELILSQNGAELVCTSAQLSAILRKASDYAAYAVQEQVASGFLTLPGGHRLGICGQAVVGPDGIKTIREPQALNLRIAREVPGAADGAFNLVWSRPASTLILGPPGRGKTTVLRDLVRQMSDRLRERIGLVDERGEVAACFGGAPQLRVGLRTDVLSLCPKDKGILLLLRAMGPQWIALDEISAPEDVEAVIRASYCGVRFLATAHAWTAEDLSRRPLYRRLTEAGVFENLVTIRPDRSLVCERIGEAG